MAVANRSTGVRGFRIVSRKCLARSHIDPGAVINHSPPTGSSHGHTSGRAAHR